MTTSVTMVPGAARVGDPHGVLFRGAGHRMDLGETRIFHGPLPAISPQDLLTEITIAGLEGRGGAGFPLASKIATVLEQHQPARVVINVAESEPAVRKDRTLALLRPHLVIDGAILLARIVGAAEVTLVIHQGASAIRQSLDHAIHERPEPFGLKLAAGPGRYVAGEASAVARTALGLESLPMHRSTPVAVRGPLGDPTLVSNAETAAQLAILARLGGERWSCLGPAGGGGSRLITLGGSVLVPGEVLEITEDVSVAHLLSSRGLRHAPQAVLFGGFAGTWVDGHRAWDLMVSDKDLAVEQATLGAGLIAPISQGCVIAEAARLAEWLALESAGQCGPCVYGLPEIAASLSRIAHGRGRSRHVRTITRVAEEIGGRGACSHPDATIEMVRSALRVGADDLEGHLSGHPCEGRRKIVFALEGTKP